MSAQRHGAQMQPVRHGGDTGPPGAEPNMNRQAAMRRQANQINNDR
jgi:hypothetical protein